jgi:hypothetical protein
VSANARAASAWGGPKRFGESGAPRALKSARYPALVDGAFIIIAWVGIKLLLEYAHVMEWIHVEVPKWLSFGLIVAIFLVSYAYARRIGPVETAEDEAEELLREDEQQRHRQG